VFIFKGASLLLYLAYGKKARALKKFFRHTNPTQKTSLPPLPLKPTAPKENQKNESNIIQAPHMPAAPLKSKSTTLFSFPHSNRTLNRFVSLLFSHACK
jgi:hypothetical protein